MTHHLPASPETCAWGYFDPDRSAVLTIDNGARVRIDTVSGGPDALPGAGFDVPAELLDIHARSDRPMPGHILTGPVAVAGAEPGDVLEIAIETIELRQDWGYNAMRPLSGALPHALRSARMVTIPLDRTLNEARLPWGLTLPLRPFFGVMGLAPPPHWGRISSIQPRAHGGNIDNKELVAGTTLYLPVRVPGALFSCGDGHGTQGDGEVCVTAIETALSGTFRLTVRKDMELDAPLAETPTHWITMGFDPDLDRCAEMALEDMLSLIQRRAELSFEDAYMLASLAGDLRITQIVNGNKGVHMMLHKALIALPGQRE